MVAEWVGAGRVVAQRSQLRKSDGQEGRGSSTEPFLHRTLPPLDPLRRTAQHFALFSPIPLRISFFWLSGLLVEWWLRLKAVASPKCPFVLDESDVVRLRTKFSKASQTLQTAQIAPSSETTEMTQTAQAANTVEIASKTRRFQRLTRLRPRERSIRHRPCHVVSAEITPRTSCVAQCVLHDGSSARA